MEIVRQTISYAEKRSANYQSIQVSEEIEYEQEEGETADEAYRAVRNLIVERVRRAANKLIERYQGDDHGK